MKSLLVAAALALAPTVAAAGDMHAFDYTGNGEPVALAAPSLIPIVRAQAAPVARKAPLVAFLTGSSDYSVFMKAEVPVETQRQALRILWATNPEFAQPDLAGSQAMSYPTEPATTTLAALQ